MDKREQFTISCRYGGDHPDGIWIIQQAVWRPFRPEVDRDGGYWSFLHGEANLVYTQPCRKDDPDEGYPADLCAEFERLIEFDPDYDPGSDANLVEIIQEGDADCAWDQPCAFGHRVDGHAVYCHNSKWLYAPRKCRRSWYTGGERRDEDCPGYAPNPRKSGLKAP